MLQKCKSKKYKEVSSHNGQNGLCQIALKTIKVGEVVEKREPSYAVCWDCKLLTATIEERTEWRFLQLVNGERIYFSP